MLLIILISSIITLFLFEEFREVFVDFIFMLIICVFVFAYSVCVFIVDYLYVFIADYVFSFISFIFYIAALIFKCVGRLFIRLLQN